MPINRLALTTAFVLAFAPGAASAATLEHTAGAGPANEPYLVYKAGKGERNRLTVTDGKKTGIVFTDPGAKIRRKKGDFGGCTFSRSGHRAVCKVDPFLALEVYLGDRNDTIRFKGGNAGTLGSTPRTEVKDAMKLGDRYIDSEGGPLQHALINGGPGNDVLRATDGSDRIDPGPGRDLVDGGQGMDRIIDKPDGAPDRLLGGTAIDTVDGAGSAALTIDMKTGTLKTGTETDTLRSIERARGGGGDDTLSGSDRSDGLFGDRGSDTVDGLGGPDYLGGDLPAADESSSGTPGQDTLTGGSGDDALDGRDFEFSTDLTPTDQLICGDGTDRILARQDDLADPSCETAVGGLLLTDDIYSSNRPNLKALSGVQPVARTGDRDPVYDIGCFDDFGGNAECTGRVQVEAPPVTGTEKTPTVLGTSAPFSIASGANANVSVTLNEAGKAALAVPGARASVHVVMGFSAAENGTGTDANFGWQQVLGP